MFDRWHLSHAQGFLALGLIKEAAAELAALPPEVQDQFPALALRVTILQAQERWTEMQVLAADLVRAQPNEAGGWVTWAYAVRRAESLEGATAILRDAEALHPRDPTIQFNLGCYASLRGDVAEARRRIARAIELDRSFAALAATDEDLVALRASGFSA